MKQLRNMLSYLYSIFRDWMILFRLSRIIKETKHTQTPVKFRHWFRQKFLGKNREVYWPVHPYSEVRGVRRIFAGVETCPGYEKGCYIQAVNPIYIGDYTQIASNVGIISANHNLYDLREQVPGKPIRIGKYCWLGMGVIVLPEVELGDFTIVGAGSVVTKSFPDGYCVIAGNPAKVIKQLNREECITHTSKFEYNGFYKSNKEFEVYRRKYLSI
jgi:acetyltransferase-like isoleucine patch superfamily enzyme